MKTCLRTCFVVACLLAATGCASDQASEESQASLAADGWTRLGDVTVKQQEDQSVLFAGQLPGDYQSICLQSDGPADIRRFGVVFPDGSTFLPEQGAKFEGAGTRIIQLPGDKRKLERIIAVYGGGGFLRPTIITIWVK